jgi:hypothetical protein
VDVTDPTATPEVTGAGNAAVAAARAHLARELGVDEAEIDVISFEHTEFSDSCLGLGGPAESCLDAITPGWLIMLDVQGQTYEVHTDETGQNVRIAGEPAGMTELPEAIQVAVQAQLARVLGLADVEIELISVEHTEFSDSCLGLGGPAESCLQAITPGWLIILEVQGQTYEVHTDETGQNVRVAGETGAMTELPEAIQAAVRAQLALILNLADVEIELVSVEHTEFSDSCLGLGGPAESCLQVITPGWLIMLGIKGEVYEVHTDESGEVVRIAGATADIPGPPIDMQGAAVYYEVSGGIAGAMDRYFIHEDGSVAKHIGPPGSAAPVMLFEVDPTRVARLIADLGKAGFFELDGDYMPLDPCCDRRTFVISAVLGDQSNTIQTMDGVEDLPLGVTESLRLLEEFVGELEGDTSG